MYRHGDSSRRCTVATVQDEANLSSSQLAASCCAASGLFHRTLDASHGYGNLIGAGRILPHGWKTGQELPDRIFPRALRVKDASTP